jgi:hypothetical protein
MCKGLNKRKPGNLAGAIYIGPRQRMGQSVQNRSRR